MLKWKTLLLVSTLAAQPALAGITDAVCDLRVGGGAGVEDGVVPHSDAEKIPAATLEKREATVQRLTDLGMSDADARELVIAMDLSRDEDYGAVLSKTYESLLKAVAEAKDSNDVKAQTIQKLTRSLLNVMSRSRKLFFPSIENAEDQSQDKKDRLSLFALIGTMGSIDCSRANPVALKNLATFFDSVDRYTSDDPSLAMSGPIKTALMSVYIESGVQVRLTDIVKQIGQPGKVLELFAPAPPPTAVTVHRIDLGTDTPYLAQLPQISERALVASVDAFVARVKTVIESGATPTNTELVGSDMMLQILSLNQLRTSARLEVDSDLDRTLKIKSDVVRNTNLSRDLNWETNRTPLLPGPANLRIAWLRQQIQKVRGEIARQSIYAFNALGRSPKRSENLQRALHSLSILDLKLEGAIQAIQGYSSTAAVSAKQELESLLGHVRAGIKDLIALSQASDKAIADGRAALKTVPKDLRPY